jgi:ribonuclease-3
MSDDSPVDLADGRKSHRPEAAPDAPAGASPRAVQEKSDSKPRRRRAKSVVQDSAEAGPAKPRAGGTRKISTTRKIENQIGHTFADPVLLQVALTHVSALKSPGDRVSSYQRLEFLGDHVLGLVVSDMLFRAYPNANEGELSKRLADLVRRETCADVARGLGLEEAIKLGSVGVSAGERLRKSVLGDICEAVIGAVFVDGGYAAAARLIESAWAERMKRPMRALRDPKTILQEWAQGRGLPAPTYREVERTGPHHDPQFRVAVDLPGFVSAEGVGGSKRLAEKAAATALIEREGVTGGGDG